VTTPLIQGLTFTGLFSILVVIIDYEMDNLLAKKSGFETCFQMTFIDNLLHFFDNLAVEFYKF